MPTKRSTSSRPSRVSVPDGPAPAFAPLPPPIPSPDPAPAARARTLEVQAPPSGAGAVHPVVDLPYPLGWWRVAGYLLAFFQPCLGLGLALLYWRGPDRRSRRFSRWCLGLALAGGLLAWMGGAFWTGLQNGESGIQPW